MESGRSVSLPPVLADEAQRIAALEALAILDTPPEPNFDAITQLIASVCQTPIALVSLVHTTRQWFKSRVGLPATETSKAASFCAHALARKDDLFVVEDALADERFATNPLVLGDPHIRFYAGAVLTDRRGMALGTLCVIDRQARALSDAQSAILVSLSKIVNDLFALRASAIEQQTLNAALTARNTELALARRSLETVLLASGDARATVDASGALAACNGVMLRTYFRAGLPPGGASLLTLVPALAMAWPRLIAMLAGAHAAVDGPGGVGSSAGSSLSNASASDDGEVPLQSTPLVQFVGRELALESLELAVPDERICSAVQLLARPGARPVVRLTNMLASLAAPDGGAASHRVDVTFDQADGEASAGPGAKAVYVVTLRDVSARYEAALEDGIRTARNHMARVKESFAGLVSHELLTPLNGAAGMLSLLARSPLDAEQRAHAQLARISLEEATARLGGIVFMVDETPDSTFVPLSAPCDVAALLRVAAHRVREQQRLRAGVSLVVDADGVPPLVCLDAAELADAVWRLADNAAKFTDAGSIVLRARLAADRSTLIVEVTDTGIGFGASAIAQLNALGADVATRPHDGLGLGLAIAVRRVRRLLGAIETRANPTGGATVVVRVPCTLPPARIAATLAGSAEGMAVFVASVDNAFADHVTPLLALLHLGPVQRVTTLEALLFALSHCVSGTACALVDAATLAPDPCAPRMMADALFGNVAHLAWVLVCVVVAPTGETHVCPVRSAPHSPVLVVAPALHALTAADLTRVLAERLPSPAPAPAPRTGDDAMPCGSRFAAALCATVRQLRLSVLIVEDNPMNVLVLRTQLRQCLGCAVAGVAGDGEQMLEFLERAAGGPQPDVVTLDLHMPRCSGTEAARRWREIEARRGGGSRLHVVGLSADTTAQREALASGMDVFVTKPVAVEALAAAFLAARPDVLRERGASALVDARDPAVTYAALVRRCELQGSSEA